MCHYNKNIHAFDFVVKRIYALSSRVDVALFEVFQFWRPCRWTIFFISLCEHLKTVLVTSKFKTSMTSKEDEPWVLTRGEGLDLDCWVLLGIWFLWGGSRNPSDLSSTFAKPVVVTFGSGVQNYWELRRRGLHAKLVL